jgi:protein TonB
LSDSEVATTRYSIGDGAAAELAVADSGFAPNQPIDKYPVLLVNSFPEYPERAMLEGLSGTVWIKSLIDVDGAPIYSKVAKYSGHPLAVGFERSALIAAMKNKFKPAIHDGKPVRVWVAFPIDFRLEHMNN